MTGSACLSLTGNGECLLINDEEYLQIIDRESLLINDEEYFLINDRECLLINEEEYLLINGG
jgi:hypothetical protein